MTNIIRSCLLLSLLSATAWADEPDRGPEPLRRLKFRNIGPAAGGRVSRACGVPGDPLVYYAATAASGLWKSDDGGLNWRPIMDDMPTSTLGSLAVAPSDTNVIYVGGGEANIRGNVEVGNGIYKSSDAGKTWSHVWKQEGQIGTMIVHPKDANTAYAAVLGKAFGPNAERGVYRTTDGGKEWKRVLFKDNDTGASDVVFDPSNPRVLFAGLWQARRRPWEMTSGGPGGGLYVSRDAGDSWAQLVPEPKDANQKPAKGTRHAKGLPDGPWGRIGLAISPANPRRIYALVEADKGGLYRSDDGGDSWELINGQKAIRQRPWYFSTLTAHPANADIIYVPNVPLLKSIDGGKTFARVKGPHHGDHHDLWIDPRHPERMINSNDGGVDITTNGGKSWYAPPLPIAQLYHIDVDNHKPYRVACTMQDIGTARGPSTSWTSGSIELPQWHVVGGGEAGHIVCDPVDDNIVYAGEYMGYISRYDHRTRQARNISIYPYNGSGHGGEQLKYRFQWTAPILLSPHDRKVLYHAGNVLFRTTDDGKTWTAISKDLTRNDRTKQKWSGGPITGDNTGVEVYGTIFALAESPKQKGLLWAGSDDGLVHVTTNGGAEWANVTAGLNKAGLPEWATVTCIEPSPHDAETAYVVADNHRMDDRNPYLFVTTDRGKTWKRLAADQGEMGFLNVVREDPKKKGMLYLGGERGLAYSSDGGAAWQRLKLNLPTVRVSDMKVKDDDLVVGTNGRSIWILDDITPLRSWSSDVAKKELHLFAPAPAYRARQSSSIFPARAVSTGPNRPAGVIVTYHLGAAVKGELKLRVLDGKGQLVREYSSKKKEAEPPDIGAYSEEEPPPPLPTEPGAHRVSWDLRYEGAREIKGAKVDMGTIKAGPLATPGAYTIELVLGEKKVTATAEVLLDPRQVIATAPIGMPLPADDGRKGKLQAGELDEQLKLALQVRDDLNKLTAAAEALRSVKRQVEARNKLLADDREADALVKASQALVKKLDALEAKMHNPKAEVAYDILAQKGGAQLYSQLAWLFEQVKDADGAPNQGWREVYDEQGKLLAKYLAEWEALVKGDIAQLNAQARKLDQPVLVVPKR